MIEYPKIYGPYLRHTEGPLRNQLKVGAWARPEFEYLASTRWLWTEKVDGTNIRVRWDGHKVTFGGRTDNAQIPASLVQVLTGLFPEELFEQTFQDTEATLFGEGYGARIQKGGGNYRPDQGFVLFDALIGGFWLLPGSTSDVATKLGVDHVPLTHEGTIQEAIDLVSSGLRSTWGDFTAEGLVGVPTVGLLDRAGRRIMMKVKSKDFAAARKVA